MSEAERRLRYDNRRVLIETERVLAPQFGSAALCLSGAQVELLRNVVAYLNRASTFVTEYSDAYYLTPTASEWDSLQSIVADLEESLMVNEIGIHGWDGAAWRKLPLLWGYSGTYGEVQNAIDVSAGSATIVYGLVGPGEVVIVTSFSLRCAQANVTRVELYAIIDGTTFALKSRGTVVAHDSLDFQGHIILAEGDRLSFRYTNAAENDDFYSYAIGYKMKIAE